MTEQQALQEILSLLPPGYVKTVPYDISKDVSFEFRGITVKMSALYLNEYLNCYMFDLAWGSSEKIYGIPIRGGIDILKQYSTPLPNMYVTNTVSPGEEVYTWRQMFLFIVDASVLERGES
ncbi:tail sheath polimerization initiator [Yersinia phage PYps3T]|uniref:Minor baseplate protein n=3 Tax=Carltongylesvirus TaxID=2732960 RepID=A0AAE7P4Y7_9CAUD|nr:hypothetical protein QNG97_gp16 [Escherichia phage MLP1]YP_010844566.1 tail sheath polimerization initiator [Yersinia phage PYps3T]YP_010844647.1 minor baseplate protein [Yersinia phage PYps23T]QQO91161.1 minor baseplate protein [Yersinia phage PYps4T]QQO91330.1 minor baseplate protein [Yersinia phage PYps16T]QQO90988.1 minor baseplate protein [Yersinia phage PYps23T]QQO91075.1 tail sheath polimerization initiator [Yersinia phage PYps3T]UEN68350.1 hypothetical protein [Escherichia phage M